MNEQAATVKLIDKSPECLILVVQGNADMRAHIRFLLGKEYRLTEAVDDDKRVELARQLMPDLTISDTIIPKVNGMNLCRELKKHPIASHIPILLLTAKSGHENRLKGLECGAGEYLYKPFNTTELQSRIKNLIHYRRALKAAYFHHWKKSKPNQVVAKSRLPKRKKSVPKAQPSKRLLQSTIDGVVSHEKLLPNNETDFLDRLQQCIVERITESDIYISDLAKAVCMTERTLNRKLKALMGVSPKRLLLLVRLNYAAKLLVSNHDTITQISYASGFSDASYFGRKFKIHFYQTPKQYRKTHEG